MVIKCADQVENEIYSDPNLGVPIGGGPYNKDHSILGSILPLHPRVREQKHIWAHTYPGWVWKRSCPT